MLKFTAGSLSPLIVNPRPVFEIDDVSVTLEWIAENGVVYSVAADQITDFRSIGRTVVNLTVLYNTPTNVTITATSCGQNSQTFTISVILNYGKPIMMVVLDGYSPCTLKVDVMIHCYQSLMIL